MADAKQNAYLWKDNRATFHSPLGVVAHSWCPSYSSNRGRGIPLAWVSQWDPVPKTKHKKQWLGGGYPCVAIFAYSESGVTFSVYPFESSLIQSWRDGQELGAHAALGEDLTSVPSTHVRQVTTAWHSSSKRSDTPFWFLWVPALTRIHSHTQTHRHNFFKEPFFVSISKT